MSAYFAKTNKGETLPKSASNSNMSDDISLSSDNEQDYENETFEEDSQDDEEASSLDTFEQYRLAQKPRTFANKTFTAAQIREIERENTILMNKILAHSRKPKRAQASPKLHVTSSAINRKKNQMKIDWENQVLLRKIQTVKPSVKY